MNFAAGEDQNLTQERPNLTFASPVTLLGGGALAAGDLALALGHAPALVAADGGADAALAQGEMPRAVIGDMDSLSAEARARIPADRLIAVAEQTSTDFEKALSRIDAPLTLAVGFTGRRTDHELAAYHGLLRHSDRRCVLLAASDVVCLAPPDLTLDLPEAMRVSLFPMAPVKGHSEGLEWPIDGLDFAPTTRIGTSNRVRGGPVRLRFDAPHMLLILPREALPRLRDALLRPGLAAWDAV